MKKNGFSKVILVIIIGVIVMLGGLGYLGYYISKSSTTPTTNPYFNKFTAPAGTFSFEYPSTWSLTKNEERGEYALEYPLDGVVVVIAEQGYSITEGSIEKNFSEALEKQKTELSAKGYINFSQSQFKKDDKYFFRLDYDLTPSGGINRKGIFLYIVKTNTFYSVGMAVDEPKYGQVINDLEHLIQTFE